MRRLGALGAGIAVVALAVGTIAPAIGSSGGKGRTVFRVVSTITEDAFLDLGPQGPSLGDKFVFASRLARHGKAVGRAGVECTFTSVARNEVQCIGTFRFGNGQITGQTLLRGEPGRFAVAVTGGTGRYSGVSGEIHVRQVPPRREVLTFHLEH
jgi:hypothetical protein